MDQKSIELYNEEQLSLLKGLRDDIVGLKDVLTDKIAINVTNPDEVRVSGKVEVNTEKEVSITNMDEFVSGLDKLAQNLELTLKKLTPTDTVTVKNIQDAIAKELRVSNLGDLKADLQAIKQAVIDNQAIVNVTEKAISWPQLAKDAIPVRLSDGKSFYKAVAAAFAGGVSSTLATDIANAMGAGGISVYTLVQKDTTSDTVNYKYYGYVKTDGSWAIKRVNRSTNYAQFKLGATSSSFGSGFYTWVSGLTSWQSYEDAF